jgi:hypothetical protein
MNMYSSSSSRPNDFLWEGGGIMVKEKNWPCPKFMGEKSFQCVGHILKSRHMSVPLHK